MPFYLIFGNKQALRTGWGKDMERPGSLTEGKEVKSVSWSL